MSEGSNTPRRTLYRDPSRGKLFGVCAGLAEYFGFELWVVRLITVTLMIFAGPFSGPIFIAYFVLAWILDKKPGLNESGEEKPRRAESADKPRTYRPDPLTVWRAGTGPQQMLNDVESAFGRLEGRLRNLEGFVTSSRFQWEKQFKEING